MTASGRSGWRRFFWLLEALPGNAALASYVMPDFTISQSGRSTSSDVIVINLVVIVLSQQHRREESSVCRRPTLFKKAHMFTLTEAAADQ